MIERMIPILLNERSAQVLKTVLSQNHPIKISDLAKLFDVSSRTIRYDLDNIDEFLTLNKFTELTRTPKVGVCFSDKDHIHSVLLLLNEVDPYHYALSPEERMNVLLIELLQEEDYITINDMADRLLVSRSTVIKDLKLVEQWLDCHHLTLESLPKRGIKACGDEKHLRQAVATLLKNNPTLSLELEYLGEQKESDNKESMNFMNVMLKDVDLPFIEKGVRDAEQELGITFSDSAFYGLVIHIAIAILRINLGKDILMPQHEFEALRTTKEFSIATSLTSKIEEKVGVRIPEFETGYITAHLLGGAVTKPNHLLKENWVDLQLVVNDFVREISRQLDKDLTSDQQLYDSLMGHLRPVFYRLRHDMQLANPLISQIKSDYFDLFQTVKSHVSPIEELIGKSLNDDEIGYLTVHIGAALERITPITVKKSVNVLVVCGTGLGTAKLLATRLEKHFDVNILNTIAYHEIDNALSNKQADVIVSTIDLFTKDIPYIKVSPFLTDVDIERLQSVLENRSHPAPVIAPDLNKLLEIIKEHAIILDYEALMTKLTNYLNHNRTNIKKGVVEPMLSDLLHERTILLQADAHDWQQAVKIGGKLLEDNGSIEHSYINAMIETVNEIGPYIVIAPGIALPHARPEAGVKEIGLSLVTLKNPVRFGHPQNDPVRIVLCLCALDHSSHLKALSELVGHLNDQDFISLLMTSTDKQEVLDYIKKEENVNA